MADASSNWYNPLTWFSGNRDERPKAPGEAQGILSWFRRAFTGWPGNEVAPGTGADRELRTERVRSGPSGVILPWFLPYFDDQQTLGENQAMRLAYRKMLADPNVKAAFLGKVLAVSSLDLKIIPADKKDPRANRIADFVRWNLTEALAGGVPNLIWSIISGALIDGYSVSEKVWELERRGEWEGHYYISNVKPKDTGRDVILMTDEFRNIVGVQGLRYNPGEMFHPSQFVIYRHLPLWDTATGVSDFRSVYSRWWLLDTVLKLRAIGLEKRSLPILLGTYETAQQRPSLESTLADVKSQNWLAVPEGVKVEALNIAGSGDSQFADAVRDLKHDIFLGIQGAILQSLEGSVTDGRGSSQVHRTTADLFVWHLSQAIQQVLNDRNSGLIRDIVDINFVCDAYPKAVLGAIDVGELSAELDLDSKLIGMGLSLSKDEMYEKYGRKPPDPDNPEDELSQAKQQADAAKAQGGGAGGNPLAALMGGAGGGDGGDGQPGAPPEEPEQPDQPDAPDGPPEVEQEPEPDAPPEPNDDLTLFAELEAFLEERKDRRGYRYCIDNGSRVKCPPRADAAPKERKARADATDVGTSIKSLLADPSKITPEAAEKVFAGLLTMTVPQIDALRKELGGIARGKKAEMARKIADEVLGRATTADPDDSIDLGFDIDAQPGSQDEASNPDTSEDSMELGFDLDGPDEAPGSDEADSEADGQGIDFEQQDASHPAARAIRADRASNRKMAELATRLQKHRPIVQQLGEIKRERSRVAASFDWNKHRASGLSDSQVMKMYREGGYAKKIKQLDTQREALDKKLAAYRDEAVRVVAEVLKAPKPSRLKITSNIPQETVDRYNSSGPGEAYTVSRFDQVPESITGPASILASVLNGNLSGNITLVKANSGRPFFDKNSPIGQTLAISDSRPGSGRLKTLQQSLARTRKPEQKKKLQRELNAETKKIQGRADHEARYQRSSTFHELGHWIEHNKTGISRKAHEFLNYRVGKEQLVDISSTRGGEALKGEMGRKDNFDKYFGLSSAYYVGKNYPDATEIVSMGIEALFSDPLGFIEKDPEYAQFIIGVLRS